MGRFVEHGLGNYLSNPDTEIVAYLLPDGHEPTDAAATRFAVVSSNLVIDDDPGNEREIGEDTLTFKATDGSGEIVLHDLAP